MNQNPTTYNSTEPNSPDNLEFADPLEYLTGSIQKFMMISTELGSADVAERQQEKPNEVEGSTTDAQANSQSSPVNQDIDNNKDSDSDSEIDSDIYSDSDDISCQDVGGHQVDFNILDVVSEAIQEHDRQHGIVVDYATVNSGIAYEDIEKLVWSINMNDIEGYDDSLFRIIASENDMNELAAQSRAELIRQKLENSPDTFWGTAEHIMKTEQQSGNANEDVRNIEEDKSEHEFDDLELQGMEDTIWDLKIKTLGEVLELNTSQLDTANKEKIDAHAAIQKARESGAHPSDDPPPPLLSPPPISAGGPWNLPPNDAKDKAEVYAIGHYPQTGTNYHSHPESVTYNKTSFEQDVEERFSTSMIDPVLSLQEPSDLQSYPRDEGMLAAAMPDRVFEPLASDYDSKRAEMDKERAIRNENLGDTTMAPPAAFQVGETVMAAPEAPQASEHTKRRKHRRTRREHHERKRRASQQLERAQSIANTSSSGTVASSSNGTIASSSTQSRGKKNTAEGKGSKNSTTSGKGSSGISSIGSVGGVSGSSNSGSTVYSVGSDGTVRKRRKLRIMEPVDMRTTASEDNDDKLSSVDLVP